MNVMVYPWSKVKYRLSNPHISYSSSSELTKAIQFGKMQFEDRNEKHYTPMRWPIWKISSLRYLQEWSQLGFSGSFCSVELLSKILRYYIVNWNWSICYNLEIIIWKCEVASDQDEMKTPVYPWPHQDPQNQMTISNTMQNHMSQHQKSTSNPPLSFFKKITRYSQWSTNNVNPSTYIQTPL